MQNKAKIRLDLIKGVDHSLCPLDFSKVIGQRTVIKKLEFFLNSHRPGLVFPSMLFTGSHGLGKTYLSKVLSKNMGRRFLEINCSAITSPKDLVEGVLCEKVLGDTPVTILFDEAHKLSSDITALLLSLLAPNNSGCTTLEYKGLEINYDQSLINTILATTDSFKIFPPLVNRCEIIYFNSYGNTELINMLKFYLPNVDLSDFENEDFADIAYACRGRGRDTYSLAQKIKRQCITDDDKFKVEEWNTMKDTFGIYPLGLNAQEITLMRIIRVAGVASCSTIATRMMIGEENVSEEIESRPKELWLVNNTSRGRTLTDRGEDYFNSLLKETKSESEVKIRGE